jgi:hypothetical protein
MRIGKRVTLPRLSIAYLVVAAAAVANSGCLLVAAAGAAGGAAGYAYYKGKICNHYSASFEDTWAAVHTALGELGMPVETEQQEGFNGFIQSSTAAGDRVRIYLNHVNNHFPADGPVTRVCVRVATFGDEAVSQRILYQVGAHLVPAGVPAPVTAPAPAPLSPVQPASAVSPAGTTGEPPLAK